MAIVPGIFREYDIRGVYGDDLTAETADAVGRAYAVFLADAGVRGAVAVGRDNRASGEALHEALVKGLTASGVDVIDVGVVPTPVMYWCLEHLPVAGGIQVTASHNPPQYNGFKICVGTRALYGDDIQRLLAIHQAGRSVAGAGTIAQESVIDRYIDDVATRIGPISRPLRLILDGSNGVGAAPAARLLERLGVDFTCLYCESDGTFPNHLPDPSVEANLAGLIAAVRQTPVDLGIALDGDADRIGVVDRHGGVVWGDRLLIVYARDILAHSPAGTPVVFDVKCSDALAEAVRAAGGTPVMWKTGHSLIEAKMTEIGSPLAGELSGHMYIADGYYGFDDAIYAAARLLRIVADAGRGIDELLADVPVYPSTPEIRVDCADDIKFGIVERAVAHFQATHPVIDVDGARVQFGDGWGLIRASNTQPALVLRFEARTPERLAAIQDEMEGWLRAQGVSI